MIRRKFQKSEPLRRQVESAIRDAIFQGRFRPGDPLRELEVARELRVSQATVREALIRLEHTGLIERVANKETRVTKLSQRELAQQVELRILLEGKAAVEASALLTPEDESILEAQVQGFALWTGRNNYFEAAAADLTFHREIWRISGNSTLCKVLNYFTTPMFAFTTLIRHIQRNPLDDLVARHQTILDALRSRDPDRILLSIQSHLENSYNFLLEADWEEVEKLAFAWRVLPDQGAKKALK